MDKPMLLTFDVDWAADFMIDAIAGVHIEHEVKGTWLVAHASSAIDRLRERPDLIELGIHPNFLNGSSHATTVAEVLDTRMGIVPEATTLRSHALVQSSPILAYVTEFTKIRGRVDRLVDARRVHRPPRSGSAEQVPTRSWATSG